MALISGEEIRQAAQERDALVRELQGTETRVAFVLIGTSAIIYVSLALLFEPLYKFNTSSLRAAMLFAPTTNIVAWSVWGWNAWLSQRTASRHREAGGRSSDFEVFDQFEYAKYRIRRQQRFSAFVMLLIALSMISLGYGIVLAALQARL
jgi:hypothetical protein